MPAAWSETPRKMLPPPMTRAIRTPSAQAATTSRLKLVMVWLSIPKGFPPAKASPLILSKTWENRKFAMEAPHGELAVIRGGEGKSPFPAPVSISKKTGLAARSFVGAGG